ncbi:leucine dehydrogenase [Aphanothece hegewaldii CCALA 016]|uniref:Leucine dehydrogenase n=1 Tax=Aphanothece hegewaldii CCALA 016 TaxID=2107694 RepID=A0A2T1M1D3_9CHRO|nr:tryptophan dehydrogenase ScyB [Aphanothece hegewaldii]PSF38503.1 leucine dehydrogenase [Aphanothece hegewaldii CCALA 016]
MNLFETVTGMGHEQVLFCHDSACNLRAIIAIHNTSLGTAMGATRLWPYASEIDALWDALRLSRGMTYKAACANIPVGGAKAVIIAHPSDKNKELLRAYGRFVNRLQGQFVTGQDVNLSPEDVREICHETQYVVGQEEKSGGPAPVTAMGVLLGMEAAIAFRWQQENLEGLRVAIQGLGNVGKHLCQYLHEQGAKLTVCDLDRAKTDDIKRLYGATVVDSKDIYHQEVEIFSPCALGGVLNSSTIPKIKASIIAGAANNQLEDERLHSKLLQEKNILYCPDYVINAGGLINVYHEMNGYEELKVFQHLNNISDSLEQIFIRAKNQEMTNHQAAQSLAEERIQQAKTRFMQKTTSSNGQVFPHFIQPI